MISITVGSIETALKKLEQEGYEAHQAGRPRDYCGFLSYPPAQDAWWRGWDRARQEKKSRARAQAQ